MKTPKAQSHPAALTSLLLGWAAASLCPAADLYVPKDYLTIQMAVDTAQANDVIHIAPGVYAGQVLVSNKSLTLLGSPGTVLRAEPGMVQPYRDLGVIWVPLLGLLQSEVVVSNLTFEGEHLADSQTSAFVGIYFLGSGGRVEDCRITGFRASSLDLRFANGLRAVNPVNLRTNAVTIQILGSTFADNLYSIVLAGDSLALNRLTFDPSLVRTTFVVSNNIIAGNGPEAAAVQDGIEILAGATGEVSRNVISDHSYVGTTDPTPFACGIVAYDAFGFGSARLAPLQPVRFEGNRFRNNQLHLLVLRGDDGAIVENTFEGTTEGTRPMGLGVSGERVVVARNRFSNLQQGVVLFGDDPDFGTTLGIAQKARLTANRFCNVTNAVTVQPLVTHTEEGRMACPFPPPALAITPAVLLSWPGEESNRSVESATTVDGPWAALPATPFLQGGQQSVAVPTDSVRRYFRLR